MSHQPLLALAAAAFAVFAPAQTLVLPPAAIAADGNSATQWPFDIGAIRVQSVLDSTNFVLQGVRAPILIHGLRLRANQPATASAVQTWSGGSSQLQLDLSTAPLDYLAISNLWAANHGPDRTTVFAGALPTPAGSTLLGQPGPFHVAIPFAVPFRYDPAAGDLTLDYTSSGLAIDAMPLLDAVTGNGIALARRIYDTAGSGAAFGTIWPGEIANAIELLYTPVDGLHAQFEVDVGTGASPLRVQFRSTCTTSDPGGIRSYAWDFDGDGTVDSAAADPTFVYGGCGAFDVSLTVTDASHPPATSTRRRCVVTDAVQPSFVMTALASPGLHRFTDTSSPKPTAWAWDFDGDGVVDSTQQHPVAQLPLCRTSTVTLTVSRHCRSATVTGSHFVAANALSTTFAADNGVSGGVVFSDLTVTNPSGIALCGLGHNCGATPVGAPFACEVWLTNGSHVGRDGDASAWRLCATGNGIAAGADLPSVTPLDTPLHLPPGSYGLGMRLLGAAVRYTGTGLGGPPLVVGNADLAIATGTVRTSLFAGGTAFTGRQWNGTLFYDTAATGGLPAVGWFGGGCAGSLPASRVSIVGDLVPGGAAAITFDQLPYDFAVALVGSSHTLLDGAIPLPLDLSGLGAPGCAMRVATDTVEFVSGTAHRATLAAGIPADPVLMGAPFFVQAAVADTVNAFGFVFSEAWSGVLGR